MEYTNWRELKQAQNLVKALNSLPATAKLLVWCGNGHHTKVINEGSEWMPMGYQFVTISGIEPFVIDQTVTVEFPGQETFRQQLTARYQSELEAIGGTGGMVITEEVKGELAELAGFTGADALLLSLENSLT